MSNTPEFSPSHPAEINPKVASDIAYWSKEFGVTGQELHEAIRVHGTSVAKVRAELSAHHHEGGQHQKKGFAQ
jgi:hypothetical protein